jgi:nucleotide-binding universal stress UspA family protein
MMDVMIPSLPGGDVIRRVLLVLDGSERAERAIPYVITLARAFGSEVVLLRVIEDRPGADHLWTDPVEWRLERSEARAYLEGVRKRFVEAEIAVDIDVGVGNASEEILETARARRADLVALTTHGCGEATAVPVAGTAHKVVAAAETSILLIPAGTEENGRGPRRVLVGLDGSPRAEWALRIAAAVARTADVPLVLAHVVPESEVLGAGDTGPLRAMAAELAEASGKIARGYLADVADRLSARDLHISTRTVTERTSVPRALTGLVAEEPDTLLVLSARGSTAMEGCTHGTVAAALLRAAEHPVLVLQDGSPVAASPHLSPERSRRRRNTEGLPRA